MVAWNPESAVDCVRVGEKEQARQDAWAEAHLSSCESYVLCFESLQSSFSGDLLINHLLIISICGLTIHSIYYD